MEEALPRLPEGGLILSRNLGQEIIIEVAGRIVAVVQLVDTPAPRKARLRVRAPADVTVDRAEVHARRQAAARQ
jgi:sRNA-binding carbon storage regulator CsrA